MFALHVALITLSFSLSASAQYRSSGSRARRIAGGAIAGIVIGCIAFLILLCICCALCFRRRRRLGGGGFGRPFGRVGPASQEAGYAPGPGTQGGWNASARPAYGGQVGAPLSGGFAPPPGPPPAAYTRGY
ncbi:hypothetical protein ONZ51_g11292 [Trametes cubensis]|uniref:Uncharacterized protein n=1 Tax=Trametes cubensis TaxID=1111947 RepID=A0AAD7X7Z8_9APHY|nr:hypothetical protein ONZ51_g11292 [Trametes cubensis]